MGLRLGVLVSGSGSNLQAIIDASEKGFIKSKICVVISNVPNVYALERAKKHNIPAIVINHKDFPSREAFDQAIVDKLKEYNIDLVVMAGFLRVITNVLLDAFPMKILNIHPALLPSFPGLHVQKKALEYGCKFAGCTVHFADNGVDTGPIIIQGIVPILDNDTEETLSKRILSVEHKIYPQAIKLYEEGRLKISGRRVLIDPPLSPDEKTFLTNPLTEL
ncbi:MAG: phosphoribosylglycinamide formyltransferase [Proteobacteria bacterium]|nr:phosphoribosylglycinamide formyltransferase [Pseudomonadota bacterium]